MLPEPLIEAAVGSVEAGLDADEWREAQRACKGMVLRQESYELDIDTLVDPTGQRHTPVRLYSAATHNCRIRCLQPRARNRNAVFHVTESEALTYHYELALPAPGADVQPDPRVTHSVNLRVDELGNVQQAIAIGYPRHSEFADESLDDRELRTIRAVQDEMHIGYVETRYTHDVEIRADEARPSGSDDSRGAPILHRRLRVPCEVRTCELAGIAPFRWSVLFDGRFQKARSQ